MAQIAQSTHLRAEIDRLLHYSYTAWSAVPEYSAEIDSWDLLEQIDFVHEWSIQEDALGTLADYADKELLTPDQRRRYEELQTLVVRHRPRIEELRRG